MLYKNIGKLLLNSTSKYRSNILINNPLYTYKDLYYKYEEYKSILIDNNIQKGSRICAIEDKTLNWIALMIASLENNSIFVPLPNNINNDNKINLVKPSIIYENDNLIINNNNNINNNYNIDPGLILFTSGSTKEPKGVVLSHYNIISNLNMIDSLYNKYITEKDSSYSLLPWNHCYGLICELMYLIIKGGSLHIPEKNLSPIDKLRDISKKSPTLIYTVPKMLETIYKKRINIIDFLISNEIKKRFIFGKNIRMISVGGSKCNSEILDYYKKNYNLMIYQGYGMTETSPMISLNSIEYNEINSVGKILPGININITKNNEILVKGENLMLGYLDKFIDDKILINKPLINDYFNTGDIGYIKNNYLYITGRSKIIYKLQNGKYINPSYIESILGISRYIDQIFVYGEGCNHNKCLIYINKEIKINTSDINKFILEELKKISKNKLENYEIPKEVKILKDPLTIENGCLSLKLDYKRDYIIKKFNL